jgi:hypothetical protein
MSRFLRYLQSRPHGLGVELTMPRAVRGRPVLTHSAAARALVLILLAGVLGFALIGVSVARSEEAYRGFVWVPWLLAGASGVLIVAILVRAFWRRRR